MARETIMTYGGIIQAALLLKNNAPLWLVLGKQTVWTDEDAPDQPTPGTTDIVEPLVALRCVTATMAREVTQQQYSELAPMYRRQLYNDQGFVYIELVSDGEAMEKVARAIYCEVTYIPSIGHPSGNFRIYGVYSGLTPIAGYESAEWLSPDHVDDYGLLLNLSHGLVYETSELARAVSIPMLIELR